MLEDIKKKKYIHYLSKYTEIKSIVGLFPYKNPILEVWGMIHSITACQTFILLSPRHAQNKLWAKTWWCEIRTKAMAQPTIAQGLQETLPSTTSGHAGGGHMPPAPLFAPQCRGLNWQDQSPSRCGCYCGTAHRDAAPCPAVGVSGRSTLSLQGYPWVLLMRALSPLTLATNSGEALKSRMTLCLICFP